MCEIEREKCYFLFLLENSNIKQNNVLIRSMTSSQYSVLQTLANDILEEDLPLNIRQFKKLVQYKDFICKLGRTKVSSAVLIKNIEAIKSIADIAFNENEVCNKARTSSHNRMGESETTFTTEKYIEHSGSGSDAYSETENSGEEFWEQNGKGEAEEDSLFESDGKEEEERYHHD